MTIDHSLTALSSLLVCADVAAGFVLLSESLCAGGMPSLSLTDGRFLWSSSTPPTTDTATPWDALVDDWYGNKILRNLKYGFCCTGQNVRIRWRLFGEACSKIKLNLTLGYQIVCYEAKRFNCQSFAYSYILLLLCWWNVCKVGIQWYAYSALPILKYSLIIKYNKRNIAHKLACIKPKCHFTKAVRR